MKSEVNPLITVYTPTYNRVALLVERAITSVLSQSYHNFEYIIVGDGCTDTTEETVKSINDSRIRFFNIKRKRPHHNYDSEKDWYIGGSYAANFALDQVKGNWIARLDDDDIWTEDHLESSLRFALLNDYDFITSMHIIIKENKDIIYKNKTIQEYLHLDKLHLDNPKIGCHSSWFYKGLLKHFKYNSESYKKEWNRVEDPDLLERLYLSGIKIGFLEKILTYIKLRPNESSIGLEAVKKKIIKKEYLKKYKMEKNNNERKENR